MFRWLTHRSFWFNLVAAVVMIVLIAILFFTFLGYITKHGKTIQVPQVTGKSLESAKLLLTSAGFNMAVQDSAYVDSLPPLTVLRQTPEANYVVKVNRTVYLTLNKRMPPMTAMPNLINYSFRSAVMTLQSQRLDVGDTLYKPDIAKNAVLSQLFEGKAIKPGTMIPEGSKITLVLGDGVGNTANPVPNLVGLTLLQALDLLSASNLNRGVVITEGTITDTSNAVVFKQIPAVNNEQGEPNHIRAGESMDLYISQGNPADSLGQSQLPPQ